MTPDIVKGPKRSLAMREWGRISRPLETTPESLQILRSEANDPDRFKREYLNEPNWPPQAPETPEKKE